MPASPPSVESPASRVGNASGKPFTVRLFGAFADAEPFHAAWNDLVLRSGSDIYQTFEWCSVWWRHYGSRRQLQLLLFFSGGELVGVIPAFVEILWLGPVRIKVGKLIGSDFSIQFCNLAVMPAALELSVSSAIRHLMREQKCDVFVVGPLSGPAARIEQVLAGGRNETELVQSARCQGGSSSIRFELPKKVDEYLTNIGSRQRGNYNRTSKRFADNHQVVTDTVSESDKVVREFDRFQSLHEAQWAEGGRLGHFKDWPMATEFNRNLVEIFGKLGMVRFFRILADGRVASSQFCLLYGGVNYWRLPARECRPDWADLSIGKMGLVRMIEASISQGVQVIEGGRGRYEYKLHLGGEEWPVSTVQFTRRGGGVGMRVKVFQYLAFLINLVYYRIFFVRLTPRVPRLKHSLWHVWIRSTW